jgi:predicted ATPase
MLDEELGIDPGRELVSLYETLLRQEDQSPSVVAAPAGTAAAAVLPSVLPRPLSSFVGREDDLDRIVALLDGSRLVTLTGPGGVGKTRLAVEAAARTLATGPAADGVWLVELGGLQDRELLAETVAETMGLADEVGLTADPSSTRGAAKRVAAVLRERRALLVLDNCEHLVDEVAVFLRDLLGATAELTVLCTSREALGITGEAVWSVPSLALPPPGEHVDRAALARWGATTLFLDRVRDADPQLVINDVDARDVVEVCRRLDGIPLALELAAARVRTLGVADLADRLEDRFAVLTGGDRTAQPRQQTLEAVIGWSWDLLDHAERTLFRRLAVFAGGVTLDAIEQVCSAPHDLPRERVMEVVAALVDKSMLVADRRSRPARYRMLETLHVYAADRLVDSGEDGVFRDRHADHLLALVADTVPRLRARQQLVAMDDLDRLLDDVRAALRWLEAHDDAGRGGRLATELGWYWYLRGHRAEGLRWLATFADRAAPREAALAALWSALLAPTADLGADLSGRMQDIAEILDQHGTREDATFAALIFGAVLVASGDQIGAARQLEVARTIIDQSADRGDAAIADLLTGRVRQALGDVDSAESWFRAALDRFIDLGDRWGQVECLASLLSLAEITGDVDAALRHADRGIDLAVELRLAELETVLQSRRAMVAMLADDGAAAEASLQRARRLADELGPEMVGGTVDLAAGFVALRSGRLDDAAQLFGRVLAWLGDAPFPAIRAHALARLGTVAELAGDLDRAATLHRDSYEQACQTGDPRSVALALEGLAATYAATGRGEDAAVLLGAAQARRASVGLPLPEVERADVERAGSAARAAVGDRRFAAALERGRTLPDEQLPIA